MLTVLMNYLFVFSIGIFIGTLCAFEVFQNQLQKEINTHYILKYLSEYDWSKDNEIPNRNRSSRKR
ncbi:MAG: hypothetical protein IJG09_01460 [Methanobrevibacter sp.]|nr:hypothetical protein [Methanobrevibacter sp.]